MKETTRLSELKEVVLKNIYDYCNNGYYHESVVINFKGEIIGSVAFGVSVGILEKGGLGCSEYPPTADVLEFKLEGSKAVIFNKQGRIMRNVTKLLNELLSTHENEILCQ